jgi:glucose uptake protein GlcU
MMLGGVGAAVAVLLAVTRLSGRPRRQAAILGATSGAMFGLSAGLLKVVGAAVSSGHGAAAAAPVAALVGVGLLGTAMNQRAYQIAPLSASLPVLNVVDVLVAVTFGVLVFHEVPGHAPAVVALQCAALACLAAGLRQIARAGAGRDAALTSEV